MGVSIYYNVARKTPLTTEEQHAINEIVERYNEEFEYKEEGEQLTFYDEPFNEKNILEGSTGLPHDDSVLSAIFHWCDCLSEIRREVLLDAEWSVSMDDIDLEWDDEQGWHFGEE